MLPKLLAEHELAHPLKEATDPKDQGELSEEEDPDLPPLEGAVVVPASRSQRKVRLTRSEAVGRVAGDAALTKLFKQNMSV
ncbi:hypothetical protein NDU88_008376 [Pleurodeles waltl]|uniref:Uncharacterized protein n=1 Tax=Pleurodeles waltl TaxID=8319 RepID=A0AAV7SVL7_PLEWA|nr:hypothetical protein NDU88_008376 [Pleurodeles waltl]